MFSVNEILSSEIKAKACDNILRALPEWFGVEGYIKNYVESCKGMTCFAAFDGADAIGFVAVKPQTFCAAEIFVMGVLPQYHRKGMGAQLVEACADWARARNCEFLTVKTLDSSAGDPNYEQTRLFYEKLGFLPLEVFPLLWDEVNPCLMMVMRVNE